MVAVLVEYIRSLNQFEIEVEVLSSDLANVIYFRCIFVRVLHDLLRKSLLHESAMRTPELAIAVSL